MRIALVWISTFLIDLFHLTITFEKTTLGFTSFPTAMVKSALLLHDTWCRKILEGNKVWELRSKNCHKRGRVGIACTSKSSPNKTTQLLGEVTLVDSIEVAEVRSGLLVPPKTNPENFLFLKENTPKHQVNVAASYGQKYQPPSILIASKLLGHAPGHQQECSNIPEKRRAYTYCFATCVLIKDR